MPRMHFLRVETWVFDLDNTLYAPSVRLFDQIEARMTAYVSRSLGVNDLEAARLRSHYWRTHGTTLAGLMAEHGLDPDPYLADVHDIDLGHIVPDTGLLAAISALPGRKVVYTNGSREHARRVTAALGLSTAFDALYGFEDAGYLAKPKPAAFAGVFARDGLDPAAAAMFEDDPRNLMEPHRLGMRTVLVAPAADPGTAEDTTHIHHRTDDLTDFLGRLP